MHSEDGVAHRLQYCVEVTENPPSGPTGRVECQSQRGANAERQAPPAVHRTTDGPVLAPNDALPPIHALSTSGCHLGGTFEVA